MLPKEERKAFNEAFWAGFKTHMRACMSANGKNFYVVREVVAFFERISLANSAFIELGFVYSFIFGAFNQFKKIIFGVYFAFRCTEY